MKRKKGFMDMKLYKKIVDEASSLGIERVHIQLFGEPLIDPYFIERVSYAKSRGIKSVTTTTNGSLLEERTARKLINAGLDRTIVSLDAATEETYKKVRSNNEVLEKIERNIKNLIKIRNFIRLHKPKVIVSFVQQPENMHETGLFINKWKNVVDGISISLMHNWAGAINKKPIEFHKITNREPCRLLWTEMFILYDGR